MEVDDLVFGEEGEKKVVSVGMYVEDRKGASDEGRIEEAVRLRLICGTAGMDRYVQQENGWAMARTRCGRVSS
jgi:hypothetical protein